MGCPASWTTAAGKHTNSWTPLLYATVISCISSEEPELQLCCAGCPDRCCHLQIYQPDHSICTLEVLPPQQVLPHFESVA